MTSATNCLLSGDTALAQVRLTDMPERKRRRGRLSAARLSMVILENANNSKRCRKPIYRPSGRRMLQARRSRIICRETIRGEVCCRRRRRLTFSQELLRCYVRLTTAQPCGHMYCRLPWEAIHRRGTVVANLRHRQRMKRCGTSETHLQVALGVKEQVLRFDIPVCYTLTMEVVHTCENLFEAAFDFGRRHSTPLDRRVQITSRAELHDLAPVHVLILHKIDRLDNVDMMESRRDAELGCELLDVFLLCLILPSFPELLCYGAGLDSNRQANKGDAP